jgi:hypothetical protein
MPIGDAATPAVSLTDVDADRVLYSLPALRGRQRTHRHGQALMRKIAVPIKSIAGRYSFGPQENVAAIARQSDNGSYVSPAQLSADARLPS